MSRVLTGLLRGFLVVFACLASTTAAAAPTSPAPPSAKFQPGQVVVRFKDTASASDIQRVLAKYPPLRETAGVYRLQTPRGVEASLAKTLSEDPAIASAAPNEILRFPHLETAWTKRATTLAEPRLSHSDGSTPDTVPASSLGPLQTTPTPTPPVAGPAITRLWLSDTRLAEAPRGDPLEASKCQGPRFYATKQIWANLTYANLEAQRIGVQLYYLGFLNREEAVFGGWENLASASNSASSPLNLTGLPVGCYEARAYSLDAQTAIPRPFRFQIVTAPLQDTFFGDNALWYLDHSRNREGNPLADVRATGAWNITPGSSDVTIAVISTGVNPIHPEFTGRLTTGYDFFLNRADVTDDFGYGTFLTGLLAANARNGAICSFRCSIVGVNWGARIMPLKVSAMAPGPDGAQFMSDAASIVEAISYAIQARARIILVTLPIDPSTLERETRLMLLNVIAQSSSLDGSLVIAPVGEDYYGTGVNQQYYPAALPGDVVLAVTATDENDRHWPSAYYGSYVGLAAPGRTYFYSTNLPASPWYPQSQIEIAEADGDSAFAAAHVAGVAALVWSVNPSLTPAEVKQILRDTADKVDSASHEYDGGVRNDWLGHGRVNAEAALWATKHNLNGALTVNKDLWTTQVGRDCSIRIENHRTSAITWTGRPSGQDTDWITINGPYSGQRTNQRDDKQGDLPSYVEICVNLGAFATSGQRTYGVHTPKITVTSLMPEAVVRQVEVTLRIVFAQEFSRIFLPLLSRARLSNPGLVNPSQP